MSRSYVRRRGDEIARKRDVKCFLGAQCVWPDCSCPVIPRVNIRPPGWTALSDWVLVRTKLGRERWAEKNCQQQAMETYLPRCQVPGRGTPQAVFPGYLFVKPGDRWKQLSNTYGVIDIITIDGRPQYVPKDVMKWLRKQHDADGLFVLPRHRKPERGEPVEIQLGAWKSHIGVYDGLSPSGRTMVLLEFMGRSVHLYFNRVSSVRVVNEIKPEIK